MREEQVGVHPAQPHRLHLVRAQRGEQVGVELAGVDHLGHLERRVVGDASAGDHLRLVPEPAAQRRRLRPAAVHHDDPDTERVQQRELRGRLVTDAGVAQHVAAQLHDEDLVAIRAHVA